MSRDGQLAHHLIDLKPTYLSIAGSTQLGPNVFWTLSCFQYARAASDGAWLARMIKR